ncbi:MAG: PD40 domain-containing protein [Candidatus Krumholzibacteriota bacterium]|nr:PD40 domain-containing protein [Candidatus Krumholzibacteriota bacterium]
MDRVDKTASGTTAPFRVGDWLVEPRLNRIRSGDRQATLEPRVMDVLCLLAARPGAVVTRRDLLNAVWAETAVGEETLTRAVSELRRALADDPRAPRYVETIRKAGYRLVATVSPAQAEDASGEPAPSPGAPPDAPGARPGRRRVRRLALFLAAVPAAVALLAWWLLRLEPARTTALEPLPALPFTASPALEHMPALSPDGRWVAFVAADSSGDTSYDLYLKERGASSPRRLTELPGQELNPRWSPDGRRLAFVHLDGDSGALCTMPVEGGEPRRLLDTGPYVAGLDWSPDGRRLVYSAADKSDGSYALNALDLESGAVSPLSEPPGDLGGDTWPVHSPDGTHLAFVRCDAAFLQDVWVMPAGGGEARRLTRSMLWVQGLDWTPDGHELICAGYMSSGYRLWRVDADSGERRWLPTRGESAIQPSLARHAPAMVYRCFGQDENIWRLRRHEDPDLGVTVESFIGSTQSEFEPDWSPDGGRIAFVSSRSGQLEIWTCDADGSRPWQLTSLGAQCTGNPHWSPDGERIAFYANCGEDGRVYLVDAAGGAPRCLSRGEGNDIVNGWSRDGRWIYFSSERDGAWRVWRMRADGGGAEPVTPPGGATACESPDGRWLYFSRFDEPGLWRRELGAPDAEPERVIEKAPGRGYGFCWGIHAGGIVAAWRDEEGPVLGAWDFATQTLRTVTDLPDLSPGCLGVSPDGLSVLYTRAERAHSDLMLVEEFR